MGRKAKQIILTLEQRRDLGRGYKRGASHCFRQRCRMVLLKSEGYSSEQIAVVLETNEMSVNNWSSRFLAEGIEGLQTKPGRGRKPILAEEHAAMVRRAVEEERQRLSQAQKIIEDHIGREMSRDTLTRFLKVITAVTNE